MAGSKSSMQQRCCFRVLLLDVLRLSPQPRSQRAVNHDCRWKIDGVIHGSKPRLSQGSLRKPPGCPHRVCRKNDRDKLVPAAVPVPCGDRKTQTPEEKTDSDNKVISGKTLAPN